MHPVKKHDFKIYFPHDKILGGFGATLATILLSVGYCTVSSVAAWPWHASPSISNTAVLMIVRTVLVRESVLARYDCTVPYMYLLVKSSRIAIGA